MELRRLGRHGLALSSLGLGTLTWGRDTDDLDARDMLRIYLDAGGRTLDVPSDFGSKTFAGRVSAVGRVLNDEFAPSELTITFHSGHFGLRENTMGPSTSRRNLLASLDTGLAELGVPSIDLWVIHGPRERVSVQEIVETAKFAQGTGRVSYVAVAGMDMWDLGSAVALGDQQSVISAIAAPFSLLAASPAQKIFSHTRESQLGFVALAPLAQGVLTGKYRRTTPPDSRAASAHLADLVHPYLGTKQARVVEAVVRTAEGLETSPSHVALAWVLGHRGVTNAVIGPRSPRQLEQLLEQPITRLQRELHEVLGEVALP